MFRRLFHLTTCQKYLARNYSKPGSAERNALNRLKPVDIILASMDDLEIGKTENWNLLRKSVLDQETHISEANVDAIVMSSLACLNRLDLAKSYIKYLENTNTAPNLATIGRYLKLVYDNAAMQKGLSPQDEADIISLCNTIKQKYSVLDSQTLESMILVLSLTKQWRNCIDLVKEIKKTASVSTKVYSAIAAAAFSNNDEQLAWEMLWQTITEGKEPKSVAYLSYINSIENSEGLQRLFQYFLDTELHCPEDVVDFIISHFKLGQKTTVNLSGKCRSCNSKVEKLHLTDSEFSALKEACLNNVIVGKDIFIKSNQTEMAKFQNFISKMKPHDVVLDGLNIAYSNGIDKGPGVFSHNISSVVSHFVQKNKTVLVLGRIHMVKWPNWNYIKQSATVFLTQNISQDDPYLLYCALQCGKNTLIVTRDLMRGHKFLLKDHKLKVLFNRWLAQRQCYLLTVNDAGKAFFRYPPDFSDVPQFANKGWHIPYIPSENISINEYFHRTWLCLNK